MCAVVQECTAITAPLPNMGYELGLHMCIMPPSKGYNNQWRIQGGFVGFRRTPLTGRTDISCHVVYMLSCIQQLSQRAYNIAHRNGYYLQGSPIRMHQIHSKKAKNPNTFLSLPLMLSLNPLIFLNRSLMLSCVQLSQRTYCIKAHLRGYPIKIRSKKARNSKGLSQRTRFPR